MKIIDLHCDTLTAEAGDGSYLEKPMYNDQCDMAFSKVPEGVKWAQLHAVFMPDKYRGDDAVSFYEKIKSSYRKGRDGRMIK